MGLVSSNQSGDNACCPGLRATGRPNYKSVPSIHPLLKRAPLTLIWENTYIYRMTMLHLQDTDTQESNSDIPQNYPRMVPDLSTSYRIEELWTCTEWRQKESRQIHMSFRCGHVYPPRSFYSIRISKIQTSPIQCGICSNTRIGLGNSCDREQAARS